jgi:hypothetical protein
MGEWKHSSTHSQNFRLEGSELSDSCPKGMSPQYPLNSRLKGHQIWSGCFEEFFLGQRVLFRNEITIRDLASPQPVHYTNYTISMTYAVKKVSFNKV